jgi:hypothetical protein
MNSYRKHSEFCNTTSGMLTDTGAVFTSCD